MLTSEQEHKLFRHPKRVRISLENELVEGDLEKIGGGTKLFIRKGGEMTNPIIPYSLEEIKKIEVQKHGHYKQVYP